MKIYFVFFRFISSSIAAAFIDFIAFIIIYSFTKNILSSLIGSRIISSLVNFLVNRNLVFHRRQGFVNSMIKYYILLCFMTMLSYVCISLLHTKLNISVPLSKIISETTLFLVSFSLQRNYVFSNVKNEDDN